ncbi:MAG: primase C-terminal domain-containing protein [Gemmatimonadetes bacterium]|nr:primase C-terminal domain-containing protein [Gemmatimonadota bacterium]
MTLAAAPPVADPMSRLPRELAQSVEYLHREGAHLLLVHNSPDPDRHKRPLWRGWQLPELRPTLQQCLEHLAHGGLLGLLPASIGLLVVDIDESDKDGLADWISRYPPLGDVPSQQPGRTHLYYHSNIPFHNRNKFQLRQYGIFMEIRSRHGFVVLWDAEAVAEIVAERSMAASSRGMTRLPRSVLGLKASPHPWQPVAAIQGLQEPPPRRNPANNPTRRSRPRPSGSLGETLPAAPASWVLPDPPEHLLQVRDGNRNNEIFDAVRHPVYQLPRGQGGEAMRVRWYALVEQYTEECNRLLPEPMRPARVQSTARSIARWTWRNPSFGRGDVMGWKDPARQREKARISARVRQERRRPRNQRMVELHRSGWSIERIARREELSWIQTWRIIAKDRMEPGIYHQPFAPPGNDEREGEEFGGNDEIRNGRAKLLANETVPEEPINQLEQPILSPNTAETASFESSRSTPTVDKSAEDVDNSPSPWEEALREGARRRAAESRRWVERARRAWQERDPPEEWG